MLRPDVAGTTALCPETIELALRVAEMDLLGKQKSLRSAAHTNQARFPSSGSRTISHALFIRRHGVFKGVVNKQRTRRRTDSRCPAAGTLLYHALERTEEVVSFFKYPDRFCCFFSLSGFSSNLWSTFFYYSN